MILGYIGPGAGFAFMGSFLLVFVALILVAVAVITWPFRLALAPLLRKRGRRRTGIRRVVIVGLDGFDPGRCRRLMSLGRLPNLKGLETRGTFRPLQSTCPPMSPVAWSTFATGVNPGKHNIFDFLNRDLQTRSLELSSSRVESDPSGRRPVVRLLRKSRPFWQVLSDYGVFSTVLRVPITFPPEPFRGLCLSGMCVPDLQGTQGTFTCYTDEEVKGEVTSGRFVQIAFRDGKARATLPGPTISSGGAAKQLQVALMIERGRTDGQATLWVSGQRIRLTPGRYSEWVHVVYKAGIFRKVHGICRFLLAQGSSGFRLYSTPVNIDPEHPSLPIAHPRYYSIYLAKLIGPFATLGLAEDTWARNEGALDDAAFLDQAYSIHAEREAMFFAALRRQRRGACVCVFDAPDRIQHMFTRRKSDPVQDAARAEEAACERVVDEMYEKMDRLVGRTLGELRKGDLLFVISDHGFSSFRRGVNLNAWLKQEGCLATLPGREDASHLQGIDWSRTKAYAFGLSGIYLNRAGREKGGIVGDSEAATLKKELAEKLLSLQDGEAGRRPVRSVYDAADTYRGPYAANGPDLVVGYDEGYRASWEAAVGKVGEDVLTDNRKTWQGDHCVDFKLVPGVLFCSRPIDGERDIRLMDLAPTVLDLLGVPVPPHMDGTPIALTGDTT